MKRFRQIWTYVTYFICLISTILVGVLYKQLPETIPTHFDGIVHPDGFGSKNSVLFVAALQWVIIVAMFIDIILAVVTQGKLIQK